MQGAEFYTAPEGELRGLMPHQMRPLGLNFPYAGIGSSAMQRLFASVFSATCASACLLTLRVRHMVQLGYKRIQM